MIKAKLGEIAAWCGAAIVAPSGGNGPEPAAVPPDVPDLAETGVCGVSTDTRALEPGQLYVPLAGERFDGHDFVAAAERAGAAAALWRRDRPLPAEGVGLPLLLVDDPLQALQALAARWLEALNARVVAVTGSNGKTTTKDMVAAVLATRYRVHKTEGNLNNHIGLPLTILRASSDAEVLVLEMGMSGRGEISLLTRIARPDVAVITNIGDAHLLQLGSRRNIARAKLEIAEGLKPEGVLVIPGGEPLLREELAAAPLPPGMRLVTFGEESSGAVRADDIRVTVDGTSFRLTFAELEPLPGVAPGAATDCGPAEAAFRVPLPGRHNAVNAAAAAAVGRLFGLGADDIRRGLAAAVVTGMRIERTAAWNGAVVLNDAYNANPTSVRAALDLVAGLTGFRRKWVLLGDMLELGPEEAALHAAIGRDAVPGRVDVFFTYGPLAAHAAAEAAQRMPAGTVRHFADKADLAAAVMEALDPADLVLVKASRGMRMEEIVHLLQAGPEGSKHG